MQLTKELAVALPGVVLALARLARDPRTPRRYRIALLALLPYLASPIDLVPDFIPVLGVLDDALIVALVVRWILRGVDHQLLSQHWSGSPALRRLLAGHHCGPGG